MARSFRRRRGHIEVGLESGERSIIAQVADEVAELIVVDLQVTEPSEAVLDAAASADPLQRLEAEAAVTPETARVPRDEATLRLFPSASREDDLQASEFRRMTQGPLAEKKIAALRRIVASLDAAPAERYDVRVSNPDAHAWMTGLTDMRLVLGSRLDLRSDFDSDALALLLSLDEMPSGSGDDESGAKHFGADDPAAAARPAAGRARPDDPAPDGSGGKTEEDAETGPDTSFLASVYDFLTWLQEGLTGVMQEELEAGRDRWER